jgi:succinoglycan biosynthesis transport protein ExoP
MRLSFRPRENPEVIAMPAAPGELDVGALRRALWRKKWRILIPTVLVAVVASTAVNMLTPKYRSEARVLIEARENVFLRPDAEKTQERAALDQEAVASQVQLILSRDLARDIIRRLKLGERPEFDPVLRGISPWRTLLAASGFVRDPLRMTREERNLETYYDRLNVYSVDRSRVIAIEFQSEDPELAARVANAVAEGYLVLQQAAKQEQARAAGQWLSGEIDNLRAKVAAAEAKVEEFRAKSSLFVGTNNTTLSNQQLGESNSQLGTARVQKADAETRARLIREMLASGRPIDASDILNSELIRRLAEQRVTLRAQLAEQSSTLLDQHPRIKELKAQIADLERQMRAEAETLVRSLENEAKIAGARMDTLAASLDQLKRQAASSNEQDVQLRALEREAKAQRDLLESYLAKYREATTRETIDAAPADARIFSRAIVSNTPAFPKKLPIVLVATLAMLVLSAGLVVTGELLAGNHARAVPAPVQSEASGNIAAVRPLPDTHPAVGVSISAIEDVAQALRAAGDDGRRVTVLGTKRNIGTTLAAVTLARVLARNAHVVLVDLALGGPYLSVISTDPAAPGIADVVRGAASFGHVITRDKLSGVHLVAAGEAVQSASILTSPRLAMTLDALAKSYDHLVIDGGAMPDITAEHFVPFARKAVLVAVDLDDHSTRAACERLQAAGLAEVTVLMAAAPAELSESDPRVAA